MTAKDPTPWLDFETDDLILQLRITLTAEQNAVDEVVQRVMKAIREADCADGKEDAIELALAEALSNAVVHGAKCDPTKLIECDVACDRKRSMLVIVRDPGNGFDPSKIPNPCVGENLLSSHGRGVYLINQLMDDVRFHKNGTEIHMIKR
jgi:serine/threonine-protein kinase RsbW